MSDNASNNINCVPVSREIAETLSRQPVVAAIPISPTANAANRPIESQSFIFLFIGAVMVRVLRMNRDHKMAGMRRWFHILNFSYAQNG